MASASNSKTLGIKVRERRQRLRSQGLTDMRAPSFKTEAHRQSLAVAASAHAGEDQAFIDAVSNGHHADWGDESSARLNAGREVQRST